MIVGIQSADLRKYADMLTPFLAEFTGRGQWTVADILDQIEAKDRQCWVIIHDGIKAVALTQISDDRIKTCRITNLTGTGLADWKDAFLEIEAWAKSLGCARIEALARPGYERVAKPYGLKKSHILLEKDI